MQDNPVGQQWSRSSDDEGNNNNKSSDGDDERVVRKDHGAGGVEMALSPSKEEKRLAAAFAHPATKDPQQIVWVPRDSLGLGEEAVRLMRERKIEATEKDATVSEKVRLSSLPLLRFRKKTCADPQFRSLVWICAPTGQSRYLWTSSRRRLPRGLDFVPSFASVISVSL